MVSGDVGAKDGAGVVGSVVVGPGVVSSVVVGAGVIDFVVVGAEVVSSSPKTFLIY